MPKTRKYRCCIRIVRQSAKQNGQAKLVLFIKGRQVEASQKHTALLACLHKNQAHIVSYKQLGLIWGTGRSNATTAYFAAVCIVDQ